MTYWSDKTIEEKYKMTDVFKNQVKELEKIVPLFKIANATIHFDESSPHLHIVGVPIKENCKTGMNKQVGKSDVFTVEILELIQTELREICINDFNKLFNLEKELKEKEEGRNEDYKVKQMKDYEKLKDSYNKQHKKITEINKNVDKINTKSNKVKDILENLKQQPLSKNNLIISSDKKDKLLEYIKDINKNNKNMKSVTNFNLSLNDIKKDLEENRETIRELLNENEDLNVKLEEKERLLQVSKNTISNLKNKIHNLEEQVNYLKNKFTKIVNHIKDKVLGLFGKDEEHTYRNIVNDLYINNKVSYEDYESMLGRNSKNKNNDDLEI